MAREKRYHVYIMASITQALCVGVIGFLVTPMLQHKSGQRDSFMRRDVRYVNRAIARETEIKRWRREKKVALIARENPTGMDLAADWGKPAVSQIPPPRSASE